ncbi:MAG: glycosyltransferase [Nostocaceae cyanobacterium]|nr:glycosyltransferase [Nostocaceae cyanobacterium]
MGSEPGIGWDIAWELAKHHQVWVITREDNREYIEAELQKNPVVGLNFIYCDLPTGFIKLNRYSFLVHLHYYLWQIQAYLTVRKLHQKIGFDLAHHVTYVRYSSPSFLSLLPIPFFWGPVGGGESAPKAFGQDFSLRGKVYEGLRNLARSLGEFDPFVRLTARRAVFGWGTTEDTAKRLYKLGCQNVGVISQLGLSKEEIAQLGEYALPSNDVVRFISIGRLLHWKGFHLGLRAFAQANLPNNTEYWIVGDGPERLRLQALAEQLGIVHQVKFWQKLSRQETLQKLGECTALVHPSLHESGGLVCLEAMATKRPVICLNLGGPAIQVTENTGIKVSANNPQETIAELAAAMVRLAEDSKLRVNMGQAGQQRVSEIFNWETKVKHLVKFYEEIRELTISNK